MSWTQLQTILWLRWRLTRNQFARAGVFNVVISIMGMVGAVVICVAAGVGGIFGGALGLSKASPIIMMLVWDGLVVAFLFAWMIGVLVELQRSESIDLARLLHLPVSLQGVFVMNYVASHLTLGIFIFVPAMLGLCLGLVIGKGVLMALLFPLALSFVFIVTAWTYCLRGWLVTLMVNPRKRRNVIAVVTLTVVLIGQLPNLYFNVFLRTQNRRAAQLAKPISKPEPGVTNQTETLPAEVATPNPKTPGLPFEIPAGWLLAHDYVPALWLPKGAMTLAEGRVGPALLGAFGGLLVGVAGLAQAYRGTLRFYLGQEKTGAVGKKAAAISGGVRKNFIEKEVPWVKEDVAALALAFFRSMMRAPEIKMALFVNVVMLIAFVPLMMLNPGKATSDFAKPFLVTGAAGFTFFSLMQVLFNQFGYDRDGFRALVLSPTRRGDVLLAKNLAMLPVVLVLGLFYLTALTVVKHLPVLLLVGGIFKILALFCMLSMVGNWISIWVPYRISAGSLKPTKPPAKTVFLMMLTHLSFPIVVAPIFIPPAAGLLAEKMGWLPASLVDVGLSLGLLGVAILVYRLSLGTLGEMMEGREKDILLIVSREVE